MEAVNPTQNAYIVFRGCKVEESFTVEKVVVAQ